MSTETEMWALEDGQVMTGVHPVGTCATEVCALHAPSPHRLRDATLVQEPSGLLRRRCRHGLTHPDPDDLRSRAELGLLPNNGHPRPDVHTCDGCCGEVIEA